MITIPALELAKLVGRKYVCAAAGGEECSEGLGVGQGAHVQVYRGRLERVTETDARDIWLPDGP